MENLNGFKKYNITNTVPCPIHFPKVTLFKNFCFYPEKHLCICWPIHLHVYMCLFIYTNGVLQWKAQTFAPLECFSGGKFPGWSEFYSFPWFETIFLQLLPIASVRGLHGLALWSRSVGAVVVCQWFAWSDHFLMGLIGKNW